MSDNKFKTGKIYKIYNNENDKFYIGSSIQELKDRFFGHKSDLKCMSRKLGVDIKDCIIDLIENYPCSTKKELLWRERFYFDKYKLEDNLNFMNRNRPIVSKEEKKLLIKKWSINNKDRIKNYTYTDKYKNVRRNYINNNREIIGKLCKDWRLKNKDYVKNYDKKREEIKKNIKHHCNLCNFEMRSDSKRKHENSQRHKQSMQVNDFLTLIENSLKNL